MTLRVRWLGRVDYSDALALQQGHGHLLRSGLLVLLQTLQAAHLCTQLRFGLLTALARRHR